MLYFTDWSGFCANEDLRGTQENKSLDWRFLDSGRDSGRARERYAWCTGESCEGVVGGGPFSTCPPVVSSNIRILRERETDRGKEPLPYPFAMSPAPAPAPPSNTSFMLIFPLPLRSGLACPSPSVHPIIKITLKVAGTVPSLFPCNSR